MSFSSAYRAAGGADCTIGQPDDAAAAQDASAGPRRLLCPGTGRGWGARSQTDARARRNRSHPRRVPYAAQVTSHIAPGMPPPGALIIIRVIMPDALAPQSDSLSTTPNVFEQAKVQWPTAMNGGLGRINPKPGDGRMLEAWPRPTKKVLPIRRALLSCAVSHEQQGLWGQHPSAYKAVS